MAVVTLHSVHTESQLNDAVATATRWLDDEQNEESFWVGMLESNSCIEAEWLLAMHFVGYEHPRKHDLVQSILNAQRADGAWQIFYSDPLDDARERLVRLSGLVTEPCELGFHFCYGDPGHKHIKEPEDLGVCVAYATGVSDKIGRPVNCVPIPVPKARDADS